MTSIHVLREQSLKELETRLLSDDGIALYRKSGPFEFTPEQLLDFPHTTDGEPPILVLTENTRRGRTSAEFEHATRIYDWLGPLSETEARDPRLWAWISHVPFADYTRARWPIPADLKAARNSIREHWFVYGEGRSSLRRHAIARLWWAVHLTSAPWEQDTTLAPLANDDPYIYTRTLLGNQEVFFHTLEREFGSDRRILIALLEVIRRSNRPHTPVVKWLAKEVNLSCRYRELNLLPIGELISFIESLAALEVETIPDGESS